MSGPDDGKKYWLDQPGNVRKIVWALCLVCLGLFVADAFYHKHPYFAAERVFGFYAIYGFVMCVGLVLAAKLLRKILMRDEDYYEKDDARD
jgi:fucose permease